MRADQRRNLPFTVALDRSTYWALREEARQLGLPRATWMHWQWKALMSAQSHYDLKLRIQWVREQLTPEEDRRFMAAVYKGSDVAYGED